VREFASYRSRNVGSDSDLHSSRFGTNSSSTIRSIHFKICVNLYVIGNSRSIETVEVKNETSGGEKVRVIFLYVQLLQHKMSRNANESVNGRQRNSKSNNCKKLQFYTKFTQLSTSQFLLPGDNK
jgi:hypothetical protein